MIYTHETMHFGVVNYCRIFDKILVNFIFFEKMETGGHVNPKTGALTKGAVVAGCLGIMYFKFSNKKKQKCSISSRFVNVCLILLHEICKISQFNFSKFLKRYEGQNISKRLHVTSNSVFNDKFESNPDLAAHMVTKEDFEALRAAAKKNWIALRRDWGLRGRKANVDGNFSIKNYKNHFTILTNQRAISYKFTSKFTFSTNFNL